LNVKFRKNNATTMLNTKFPAKPAQATIFAGNAPQRALADAMSVISSNDDTIDIL
jgi:hypothetical protein